ncbi:hypothetical protein [Paraburkholderia sp. XV]|uniref:hypothetical protein n=1 Tax=Paraburkholderia sp. XV TaxID=2831520 RepID=UPI001CD6B5B5|nr:hypothetical protein [Paraburkholderia sp. XV]
MATPQTTSNTIVILWWLTRDWKAADGLSSTLQTARDMLAPSILALNGAGFPRPDAGARPADPSTDAAWQSCAGAVRNAATSPSYGNYVLLWTFDPAQPLAPNDQSGLGLNWPFLPASHVDRCSGSIQDTPDGVPKRLFFFDSLDPDAPGKDVDVNPGFWPKPGAVAAQAAGAGQGAKQGKGAASSDAIPAPKKRWATMLFVIWGVASIYVTLWMWNIVHSVNPKVPAFLDHFSRIFPSVIDSDNKTYSLEWPWLIIMASFMLLIAAVGLYQKGLWFGALIDSRNSFSLSRTQQLAWSVLLLGSLAVVAWFNAAWLVVKGQHLDLFPTMGTALWAALGINLAVSPLLRNSVLTVKKDKGEKENEQSDNAPVKPKELVTPALLDKNQSPAEARWIDLVMGENEGTQNQVDISRLQHLIISGLLLSGYFLKMLGAISGLLVVPGHEDDVFKTMPDPGNTFIELLAFSHAGYLIFKARSADASKTGSQESKTA